jgi:hypothetical protein
MHFSKSTVFPFTPQELFVESWFEEHEGELQHLPWAA